MLAVITFLFLGGLAGCAPMEKVQTRHFDYDIPTAYSNFDFDFRRDSEESGRIIIDAGVDIVRKKYRLKKVTTREVGSGSPNYLGCLKIEKELIDIGEYKKREPLYIDVVNSNTGEKVLTLSGWEPVILVEGEEELVVIGEGSAPSDYTLLEALRELGISDIFSDFLALNKYEVVPRWRWDKLSGRDISNRVNSEKGFCNYKSTIRGVGHSHDIADAGLPETIHGKDNDRFHFATLVPAENPEAVENWVDQSVRDIRVQVRDSLSRKLVRNIDVLVKNSDAGIVNANSLISELPFMTLPTSLRNDLYNQFTKKLEGFPDYDKNFRSTYGPSFTIYGRESEFSVSLETFHDNYVGLDEEIVIPSNANLVTVYVDRIGAVQRDAATVESKEIVIQ